MHTCPVCQVPISDRTFRNVRFQECERCAGIWITAEALKRLEREGPREMEQLDGLFTPTGPATSAGPASPCPACGRAMQQYNFMMDTPILLHTCQTCSGLWIDDGELTAMAAAIEQARRPTSQQTLLERKTLIEAQFEMEHERTMARYREITRVFSQLRWAMPWWSGF